MHPAQHCCGIPRVMFGMIPLLQQNPDSKHVSELYTRACPEARTLYSQTRSPNNSPVLFAHTGEVDYRKSCQSTFSRRTADSELSSKNLVYMLTLRFRQPDGFSFSGSTSLARERPCPAAGWIFLLWQSKFSTGRAGSGNRMDSRSLVVQVSYWNGRFRQTTGFSIYGNTNQIGSLVLEGPFPATGLIFALR